MRVVRCEWEGGWVVLGRVRELRVGVGRVSVVSENGRRALLKIVCGEARMEGAGAKIKKGEGRGRKLRSNDIRNAKGQHGKQHKRKD